MTRRHRPNRWKGFMLGAAGGSAGLIAMSLYWNIASALTNADPNQEREHAVPHMLDSIAVFGNQLQPGESSTEGMGRLAYHLATGQDPRSDETRSLLSTLVHWGFGMSMGGVYGAIRGKVDVPDVWGGLVFGAGLCLFAHELAVPLLGLAKGPTASPLSVHAHELGGHLAYGLATAAVTQLAHRVA